MCRLPLPQRGGGGGSVVRLGALDSGLVPSFITATISSSVLDIIICNIYMKALYSIHYCMR